MVCKSSNADGNLKIIVYMVKRPCLIIGIVLGLTIIISMVGIIVALNSGEDIINTPKSDADITHITAINHHAWLLATEESNEDTEEAAIQSQQTKSGGILSIVFEATGSNFFETASIVQARTIQQTLIDHPEFPSYCLRSGNETLPPAEQCILPVSPLNLFYASEWNQTRNDRVAEVVDTFNDFFTVSKTFLQCYPQLSATLQGYIAQSAMEVYAGRALPTFPQSENDIVASIELTCPLSLTLTQYGLIQAVLREIKEIVAFFDGKGTLIAPEKVLPFAALLLEIPTTRALVDYYFEKGFSKSNLQSKHTRLLIKYGYPLEGFSRASEEKEVQEDRFNTWFQTEFRDYLQTEVQSDDFDTYYFASSLSFDEILAIMLRDAMKAIGSMIFVYGYVTYQTGSFFLATAGMTEILISLPFAYAFYSLVFQFAFLSVFCSMCVYIVMAIGADDVFVFQDAYFQSAFQGPTVLKDLETRMTWVYRRAAGAMFITSFTTMAAFVATALSPLTSVQSFGIFAAFVILADFILVITFYPACVIWYHNNLELRGCCGGCKCCTRQSPTSTELYAKATETPPKRKTEAFLENKFAPFVTSHSYPILACFLIWTIVNIIFVVQIEPATQADQFLPSSHPFQRIADIQADYFGSSSQDSFNEIILLWGVKGVDRSGVALLYDPNYLGQADWDESFVFDEVAQTFLLSVCETIQAQSFVARDKNNPLHGAYSCFLEDVQQWSIATNRTFPIPVSAVVDTLELFLSTANIPRDGTLRPASAIYGDAIGIFQNQLRYVAIKVESLFDKNTRYTKTQLEEGYATFEAYVDQTNSNAPASMNKLIQTDQSQFWIRMRSQEIYVISAITGALTGLCLAFVVILIATKCVRVAVFAAVTIGGILLSVLAFMVGIGWELGTIESINVTILAGFSVDYVVHLAHSYMVSKSTTRIQRVHDAIAEIGISVFSGMTTSVGASLLLFTCELQFFAKFGGFLCSTILFSWIWANFAFMTLLALFGPEKQSKGTSIIPFYL